MPPNCQLDISGNIDTHKVGKKCVIRGLGVLEGVASLVDSTGLIMARSLVECNRNNISMPVINLNDRPVTLEQGKTVAILQPACSVVDLDSTFPAEQEGSLSSTIPEHLESLYNNAKQNLDEKQGIMLMKFLSSYQDVFAKPDGQLGVTHLVTHSIDTGDAAPIKQPPRRLPWSRQAIADQEVDKMLKQGIIEESDSPWASPVVLVTKKDLSVRFCIDYRKTNDVT